MNKQTAYDKATAALPRIAAKMGMTALQLSKACGFKTEAEYIEWLAAEIAQPGGSDEDDTMRMLNAIRN